MIWSIIIKQCQISIDFLSKLGSPQQILPSINSLSTKKKIIGSSTLKFYRKYSTSSANSSSLGVINNHETIKFDSLEIACEEMKFKYLGVSGVYKLTFSLWYNYNREKELIKVKSKDFI